MLEKAALKALQQLLPRGQVFTEQAALIAYEVDAGMDRGRPEGVVFPRTDLEVSQIARWASRYRVPLIARGAGTGLSGGAVADRGGVIIEFSQMQQILNVEPMGRSARVEPAVINLKLDERVRGEGLYFPPDPASQRVSTIGGNVAENSGGPHCFKYGVTTNYITGLDIVLADGYRLRVGGQALDYPEYDLCGALTGSEGMLALLTGIFVRLLRNPPGVKTLLVVFDTIEEAGVAVSAIIAAGLVPAAMEMMDQKIIKIIEEFAHANLPLDAAAALIIEVDGFPASLESQIREIEQILSLHGGREMRIARDEDERARIWLARKSAAGAISRLTPAYYTVDITVPRSRLAEMLGRVNQICERHGLRSGHVFHAGDGNLHPLVLIPNPGDRELLQRVQQAGWEMVQACVEMGGSLTGEHGVGIEKRTYMSLMHNQAELLAMWDLKQVFDPTGLLNPGKVFPPASAGENVPYAGYVSASMPVSCLVAEEWLEGPIFTPSTAIEAAEGLASLSRRRRPVLIGGACAPGYGERALRLRTTALSGIKVYAPEDLYITVGAGTSLGEIQSQLAEQRQQVALASPWREATIGGLVATNLNAPLRMRYGALRDQLLCLTVALADGRVIRTGRPVAKNVAGYDLTRLIQGAYGTLGLIVDVSLKLHSQPRIRRSLLLPSAELETGLAWGRSLLPVALIASALTLSHGVQVAGLPASPYVLTYSVEGLSEDVESELAEAHQALRAIGAPPPLEVEEISGTDLWLTLLGATEVETMQVRVGLPVQLLPMYMREQRSLLEKGSYLADFSSGQLYVNRVSTELVEAREWLSALRRPALAMDGYALLLTSPEGLEAQLERWGYLPESLQLMQALKARWDPAGILNPGVFLGDALLK